MDMFEEINDNFVDSEDINNQFDDNTKKLEGDIQDLDTAISNVKKHIFTIESSMSAIESSIQNNKSLSPADKSKMFQVINKLAETLNLYYSSLQRFMDLKFKYRAEQNGLKYKIIRMINIELKDFKKDQMTNNELMNLLKKYQNNAGDMHSDIDVINDDPIYKI